MKNKLKITFISLIISTAAYSDCRDYYKRYLKEQSTKALGITALGVSTAWVSPLPLYIGYVIGTTGEPIAGISCAALGAGSLAFGAQRGGKGISLSSKGVSVYKVYRLINESQTGIGSGLENLAEDLSEELDRDISESVIAEIINTGNTAKDFCENGPKDLYNKAELLTYIKEKL